MRSLFLPLTALLAALLCAVPAQTPGPVTSAPRLLPRACGAEAPRGYQLRCDWLQLGDTTALAAARLVPMAGVERAPLLYLAGGPGQGGNTSAESIASWAAWAREAAPERELILVDLRHTPGARGAHDCPAYSDASRRLLGEPLTPLDESRALAPVLTDCLARLRAVTPFSSYSTSRYAADLRALQVAYGDASWTLLGVSYGTRLAWVAADYLAVERLVLDSPYPPGLGGGTDGAARMTEAFAEWWAGCDAGRDCPAQGAGAEALFWQAVAALDRQPRRLSVADWTTGARAPVMVNGARLILAAYSGLYREQSRAEVWPLVLAAATGAPLPTPLFEQLYNSSFDPAFNAMTFWLTECNDNAPAAAAGQVDLGPWRDFFAGELDFDVCAMAGLGERPLLARPAPAVPVLAAVGSRDPITPPAYAAPLGAAAGSHLVQGVGAGHAEYLFSDCGIAQIRQWLRAARPADCGIWRAARP